MLALIAEHAWVIFGCCFCIFLVLAWWFRQTGERRALFLSLIVLALALLPVLVELLLVTPEREIRTTINQLMLAGERRDTAAIMQTIDDGYDFHGINHSVLRLTIERELTNYQPNYVSASSINIDADKEKATSRLTITTGGMYSSGGYQVNVPRYLVRLEFVWRKRDNGWKITQIRRFDPDGEDSREIPLATR